MRKYGCIRAIPMSFYSRDLYRDVAQNWKGGVLLYLLLVLSICWAFLSVGIQKTVNVGYGEFAGIYFPQIPEMTITKGELKTPENRPYLITDENKKVIAIIDTSGQYADLEKSNAEFLVTKSAVIYKDNKASKKSYEYPASLTLEMIPAEVRHGMDIFVNWIWVLFFPVLLLFSFIYRLIQSALYAILGELFVVIARIPLTYGEIFKLTIFAITPSILIGTVLDWFSVSFSHVWLGHFILSMGYLIFAIRANKPN